MRMHAYYFVPMKWALTRKTIRQIVSPRGIEPSGPTYP
jgi:hypothetical protein